MRKIVITFVSKDEGKQTLDELLISAIRGSMAIISVECTTIDEFPSAEDFFMDEPEFEEPKDPYEDLLTYLADETDIDPDISA